jgi:hypothetical protein
MAQHHHCNCVDENHFPTLPAHNFCKKSDGDEGAIIFKYKWNRDLLCLVNQLGTECSLAVIYDYSLTPGQVFHFTVMKEATDYLHLFFARKSGTVPK